MFSQKEQKLMYLIYLIEKEGFPVSDLYDKVLRDVDTERFLDWLQSNTSVPPSLLTFESMNKHESPFKALGGKIEAQEDEKPSDFPFDPDASYETFWVASPTHVDKPDMIPGLDFADLPAYETSSDEEDDETHGY